MFNLEQSITEWRRQMIAGGIKSSGVLDELESHLREDVEWRMHSGTPAQQAFEEAAQQIGRADELKLEFGKIEPQRPAVSPKLINRGCVAMGVFIVFTGMWLLFDAPIAEKVLGFAWLALVGVYVALLPHLNRNLWPGVGGWAFRKAFILTGTFLVASMVTLLLLECANVIHIPLRVPEVIFWPVLTAVSATIIVLSHATDWKALGLWSPAAEESFAIAEVEALNFHHNFVGTEHLLLGLLGTKNSRVPGVLSEMGVSCETVRAEIEKIIGSFPKLPPTKMPPCTPRAKKALRLAMREAKTLRRDATDTEHILLGLILEGTGVAGRVLKHLGVNPEKARAKILKQAD